MRKEPEMTFYALIQKGVCVLGLGTTKEEALVEVCEWQNIEASELEYTEYYSSADEDKLVLLECTEDLYNLLQHDCSAVYEVSDNIADIYNQ